MSLDKKNTLHSYIRSYFKLPGSSGIRLNVSSESLLVVSKMADPVCS